jgi:murein DD-endopeptidase MepM/ murein hydrolase activator NlpD
MWEAAFWSGYGRGVGAVAAASVLGLALAGCSGSVSRFDFPAFNLSSNDTPAETSADVGSTSSLPPVLPEESVYRSGGAYDADHGNPQLTRASLPPPSYTPRPSASYSPARGRIGAAEANYPDESAPPPEPALLRKPRVSGQTVKVGPGETLSSLSRRYGVPVETIMSANNLPDGRLSVGQELIIPGARAPKVAAASPPPAQWKGRAAQADTPHGGADPHDTKPRHSAEVAEKEEGPEAKDDASANGPDSDGQPPVHVVKTTTIRAPGKSLAEEEADNAGPANGAKPGDPAGKSGKDAKPPAKPEGDVAASPEITGEDKQRVANVEQLPNPDPMSGASFRWPVKGRVISEFGARPDGGHNDGIDLAVPQGTEVKAAENGVVAYAGNELKGYGNLVLIRHANNWVSAYAHNEALLVKRGDKVTRGQVIAKAGATGAVSQPLVHFELRKGSRPVDPTKYMSAQAANAD